jgi:hypothetical protein
MPAADHGFKIIARDGAAGLARLAGLNVTELEPVESTVQTTAERLADRVFATGRGRNRFLVYMEFVTTWDQRILWPLLSKTGLLAEAERLPVKTLVFILQPRGYQSQNGTFRLEVAGRVVQQVWFQEVPLWEVTPEPWWEQVPALMALYPLCEHDGTGRDAIQYASQVIEHRVPDPPKRADLLAVLGYFGGLSNPDLNIIELIGRSKMVDSPFFQQAGAILVLDHARYAVRSVLEDRFGTLPEVIATSLDSISEQKRLDELLLVAARSTSLDEFRAALGKAPRRRKTK